MKRKKSLKQEAEKPEEYKYHPALKNLIGCIKLPPDFDYKKDLMEEMYKKHVNR